MKEVVFHHWLQEKDGQPTLYEVDYWSLLN